MSQTDPHRPRRAKRSVIPAEPAAAQATTAKRPWYKRRGRVIGLIVAIVALLLILAVVIAGTYLNRIQDTFTDNQNVIEGLDDLDDDTAHRTPEGTINILMMGSDSRGDDEEAYRSETGEEGERSDSMMLVHIPEDRSGVYVMSIMRDLWVDIPGHGEGRVNSALSAGGLDLAVQTVEEMLYTHIDHVMTIDFEGFSDLTEELGGVYVDNPRSFSAGQRNPTFYPEGNVRLAGDDALRFVRERKSFDMGDHVRVENQQLVMRAIVDRFLSGDTLGNPDRIVNVLEAILPFLEMDSGLDSDTLVGYAMDMRNLRGDDIHTLTMPTGENTVTTAGAQVLMPDDDKMQVLRTSLQEENMSGFMAYLDEADEAGNLDSGFLAYEDDDEDEGSSDDSEASVEPAEQGQAPAEEPMNQGVPGEQ